MRYRPRTLLIVLALTPPVLAWAWWAVHVEAFADVFFGVVQVGGMGVAAAYVAARFAAAATGKR